MLAMAMSCHAFNLISEQDQNSFKNRSSSEIKPEMYAKILELCDKSEPNIESCLQKMKSKSSAKNLTSGLCCWNVSNQYGDYVNYRGQELCIPECH